MENPTVADGNTLDSNNSEMTEVIRLDTEVDIATIDMEEFSVMMKVTDQERETMKFQHQAEILKLKNEYEAKIAELTNPKVAGQTYAAENGKYSASDVEAGPSNTVMLKRNHNGEILRVNYEERIAELIHQNDVLKQSHAKEVLAMKLSHANEVSTMKKQCDERIAFANQEIELIKTTNTFANQTLREDYEKLIFENKKKAWVFFFSFYYFEFCIDINLHFNVFSATIVSMKAHFTAAWTRATAETTVSRFKILITCSFILSTFSNFFFSNIFLLTDCLESRTQKSLQTRPNKENLKLLLLKETL